MKVKLTTVFRDNNIEGGLRTPSVEGECVVLPSVGKRFTMTASALVNGFDARFVSTSQVMDVDILDNIITFHTESGSVYTLEVLGE